ncbi:hypothetical protein AaE_011894, partial [Aphanomyces astaci]
VMQLTQNDDDDQEPMVVTAVGGGAGYTCVLLQSGQVFYTGQVLVHADAAPPPSTEFRPLPLAQSDDDAWVPGVAIACGPTHCAIVASTGRVMMWGSNNQGQILPHDGTTNVVHPPMWLPPRVSLVACGESHSILVVV